MSCTEECGVSCPLRALDREETASRVYSVRRHKRALMLELAVGWAR